MTVRSWVWIGLGLAAWTALVILWATGPHNCTAPDPRTGKVSCQ